MAFPTPLLDAKLAQQRRQAELDRQRILADALQWLFSHGMQFGILSGYVFGSATKPGHFSAGSDVDLAVESLKAGDPFGLMSDLSLYLNRDVDLVPLDQCHFATKIRETGTPWNVTSQTFITQFDASESADA
ncbi:MAG: nucleotidyltransferase domain-containing protein [Leptolyngbya sp. SIO1D8]|nr:nucleotidyltransferase domain-containing protein [Leptolyngbya sp. SIO1D8]